MAFIRKNRNAYYLVESYSVGGKKRQRNLLYIGKEQPWPKSQGWSGIKKGSRQYESLFRIVERKKKLKLPKPATPEGKYRTIVIDPPWPVAWPKRLSRPNQLGMPYATMSIDEIKNLPIPDLAMADGCHLYLWTTHGFLPEAFSIMQYWGFNYKCLLTWVKNVGFTPYSFMFNTEFCLFGQLGKMQLLKLGEKAAIFAKAREHSRKPDNFYKLIRKVSPEPRFEMFGREDRTGFKVWGDEITKFEVKNG